MKKYISTVFTAVFIILLAVGAVFLFRFIIDQYDRMTHPLGYSEYVEGYATLYGVPSDIIYAVIRTESSFEENALSPKGAVGLMQITPDTFTWLMTKTGEIHGPEKLYIPQINIKYGVFFLSYLYGEFNSWETVYAAYNAGMSRVKGWLDDPAITEQGRLVNIPFEETENYIKRVEHAAENYRRLYQKE